MESLKSQRDAQNWLEDTNGTYKQRLFITFCKCSNNEAPEKLCRNIMEMKNKNLRGEETAVIQRPQKEFLHASVSFRGAVLWNKLPAKIRNERNYEQFKRLLDKMDFACIIITKRKYAFMKRYSTTFLLKNLKM